MALTPSTLGLWSFAGVPQPKFTTSTGDPASQRRHPEMAPTVRTNDGRDSRWRSMSISIPLESACSCGRVCRDSLGSSSTLHQPSWLKWFSTPTWISSNYQTFLKFSKRQVQNFMFFVKFTQIHSLIYPSYLNIFSFIFPNIPLIFFFFFFFKILTNISQN